MYITLAVTSDFDVNPKFLLLSSIPYALTGGFCAILTSALCYVTDITDKTVRPKRLIVMDATYSFGSLCGTFAGPAIFKAFGYSAVFAMCALCCALGVLYAIVVVEESVNHNTAVSDVQFIAISGIFMNTFQLLLDEFNKNENSIM